MPPKKPRPPPEPIFWNEGFNEHDILGFAEENQKWSEWAHENLKALLAQFEPMQTEIAQLRKELQQTRQELKKHVEAAAKRPAAEASPDMQPFKDQIAAHTEQLAALQLSAAEAVQLSNTNNAKPSYAAAAGQQSTFATNTQFRVTLPKVPMQGKQIPTDIQAGINVAQAILKEVGGDLRPTDVQLQWTKHGAADKSKPVAVIISMLPIDARILKAKLWDKEVEEKLQRAGWRVNTHLPLAEYKSKQALWALFEKQLTPAVRAGKRLLYTQCHQAVQIDGEKEVMQLPQGVAAAGTSSG
jgi:HAMP domain-containing protein